MNGRVQFTYILTYYRNSISTWVKTSLDTSGDVKITILATSQDTNNRLTLRLEMEFLDMDIIMVQLILLNHLEQFHWILWYHLTAIRTNNQAKLYVNGIEQTGTSSPTSANVNKLWLGGRQDAAEYWNGSIDDVQIFNRALSQDEITQLYNQGRGKYSSVTNGLVAQYSGRDFAGTQKHLQQFMIQTI